MASFYSSKISQFLLQHSTRSGLGMILRFLSMLIILIVLYASLFDYLMQLEGRDYSFVTGVYWSVTVMSTLGFGDITFQSDLGKLFSILVLFSGIFLFLTMLPFMFTQYIYAPWLEAQKKERTPRAYTPTSSPHVIIVNPSPIALNLADNLKTLSIPYVLLCQDSQQTMDLLDRGYVVVAGEHDSTKVYQKLALSQAAMLVALDTDTRNTNIVFTVRESGATNLKLVDSALKDESREILNLAGCNQVFQFQRLLGEALARRVLNDKARCSIILRVEDLVIAEAPVMRTQLVNETLKTCGLRAKTGVNVVGLWERGQFRLPFADSVFTSTMVMVIAGTAKQIEDVNTLLGPGDVSATRNDSRTDSVVILGGGGVGLAAARFLKGSGRQYCLIDKEKIKGVPEEAMVTGDASDLNVLDNANFRQARSVIITTHDDDTNIYLTLYCRRLRKDIQIISRANLDRNIPMLHNAGADLVLSLASMVSNSVINLLSPGKMLMINEGLNIFRSTVKTQLEGKQLHGSGIRSETHCSVVALRDTKGDMHINPDPNHVFQAEEELFLIGDTKAEKAF
ncbi:MAG: NAD-binding protein, partial [Desulfovibrionaceae bacterium]|nr:NAD-binding protein [Desulfovibrionaceae bacterium]